tara:strand:- start:13675 stop:13998 length:324 start_codon:yes stop_codon:yes gene_type:complete
MVMDRYIFIDRNSGFIFGDTADHWWRMDESHPIGPLEAAKSLDRALMMDTSAWSYSITNRHDPRATYDVYSADETVPASTDGQDQEMINAVLRTGRYIDSIFRAFDN